AACHGALHEQLGRRERLGNRRSELRIVQWTSQRIQSVDVLTLNPEGFTTRRQDVHLRCCYEDVRRELRHCLYEMFAGVENQKNALVPQISNEARCSVVNR